MPDVKVTVKLSFEHGEEQLLAAGIVQPRPAGEQTQEAKLPPYRVPKRTACDEPTLIESASFVKVG